MSIITYALLGKLPLHAKTTQITDVRVQEDCSSNSKYYLHYIPRPTCRGPVPLYVPPLSYKRGGMQRYKTDTLRPSSGSQVHTSSQAQYITQWSRVLRSGGPNHSKPLRVPEFIVHLPTGKMLMPPPHLRI
jgi:hypothetical protein